MGKVEKAAEDSLRRWLDWKPLEGWGSDVWLLSVGRFRIFSVSACDAIRLGKAEAEVLSIVIVASNWRDYRNREVFWGGRSLTSTNFEYATAKPGYAYSVDEQSYSGYHTEWFGTAEEAWDCVKAWKGHTMRVRYCPRRPEVSVWREQEQVEISMSISVVRAEHRRHGVIVLGYADFFTCARNSITFPRLSGGIHAAFLWKRVGT
jgi:hypothetical protein